MRTGIGIDPDYDCLFDPQQQRPVGFCIRCGREIYKGNPHDVCWDCYDIQEDIDPDGE